MVKSGTGHGDDKNIVLVPTSVESGIKRILASSHVPTSGFNSRPRHCSKIVQERGLNMLKIILAAIAGGFLGFFLCAWLTAGALADARAETGAYA